MWHGRYHFPHRRPPFRSSPCPGRKRKKLSWTSHSLGARLRFVHDGNHPPDAEAILEHAEFRSPESLLQRHGGEPAFSERGEDTLRLRFSRHRNRKRKTLE